MATKCVNHMGMERLTFKSVPDVFEKFSIAQMAAASGAKYSTARAWKHREKFPSKYADKHRKLFESHGYTALACLWGLDT